MTVPLYPPPCVRCGQPAKYPHLAPGPLCEDCAAVHLICDTSVYDSRQTISGAFDIRVLLQAFDWESRHGARKGILSAIRGRLRKLGQPVPYVPAVSAVPSEDRP